MGAENETRDRTIETRLLCSPLVHNSTYATPWSRTVATLHESNRLHESAHLTFAPSTFQQPFPDTAQNT